MKRNDLLKHLRPQGCEFIKKVVIIRGGGIQFKTNDRLCRGIQKSTIPRQERHAMIL
ncbi:MAG: hypothetical protein M5U24_11845 [Candidatus Kuenenia sp.]|uniref:hypothetical protein n=1 Tax=Candidatus Kuenenia sp. TaxID=2499824 RepID=UPI0022C0AB59|nr:hypothetical protein [Candidatus Kuenenia sp.]MCZ7623149.1 hypothetical protein [Candidatus Kuenenia sp.]